MMGPNADTNSLAIYYLASRKAEKAANELIDELRTVLQEVLRSPEWVYLAGMRYSGHIVISPELYDRAMRALEAIE